MEENEKKHSKALYISIAISLAVISIIIIAASIANKGTLNTPIDSGADIGAGSNSDTLPDFSLPTSGEIAIDYSDSVPVFSQTMNDYRTHLGVDISASLGTPVMAVADGIVTNVWEDPFMGTSVSIEHSGNAVSIYKNLAPEVAEGIIIGASVKCGDTIGAVGESAMNELAEEPHLHYEMKINGKHVDPKEHLPFPAPKPDENTNTENGTSSNTQSENK